MRQARTHARIAAEQEVLNRERRAHAGTKRGLNGNNPSGKPGTRRDKRAQRLEVHKVQLGRSRSVPPSSLLRKGGAVAGILGALLAVYDVYKTAKDLGGEQGGQITFAPLPLADEGGVFTLRRGLVRDTYFKVYHSGRLKGRSVEIAEPHFEFYRREAEALWGTVDEDGNFVPGLLQRELQPHYDGPLADDGRGASSQSTDVAG